MTVLRVSPNNKLMVIAKCECFGCNNEFETYASNIKRGWGRFCSKSCKASAEQASKFIPNTNPAKNINPGTVVRQLAKSAKPKLTRVQRDMLIANALALKLRAK